MNRSAKSSKSIVFLSALLLAGVARAEDVPDVVKPFVDTIDRCQKFQSLVVGTGWKESYRQTFDDDLATMKDVSVDQPDAAQVAPQLVAEVLTKPKDQKGTVQLNAVNGGQAMLKVGPTVTGEFAVQFKGKVVSDMLCDLSLMLDGVSGIGSFQFGGWVNTKNTLVVGTDENGRHLKVDGEVPAQIVPMKWHTVRLEMTRAAVKGIVDGKVIVVGKLPNDYDWTKPRQPMVYVYASTAVIDEFIVERPAELPGEGAREAAWKEAFVKKTPEQVQADLVALTKLLNDPEFAVRQTAHEMLARAGSLAREPLIEAAKSGPLEGRDRAASLLRAMGVAVAPTE